MGKIYPDWLSNLSYKAGYYLTKALLFIALGLTIYGIYLFAASSVITKIIVHLIIAVLGVLAGTYVKLKSFSNKKLLLIAVTGIIYATTEIIVLLSLPWQFTAGFVITLIGTTVAIRATKNKLPGEKTIQIISKILFYSFNLSLGGYLYHLLFLQ
ncbi:MAG: hypothetical protein ACD_51C00039G0004 [uncultured bacterium]|nr:MAG: hypothetical protein ACD_51C00039G0004 [uncultured bacterium]